MSQILLPLVLCALSSQAVAQAPYLQDNTLYILGTDGPDSIQVSEDGNQWKIKVTYNDGEYEEEVWFAQSDVN